MEALVNSRTIRARPVALTVVLSVVGYALVIGTFVLEVPFYPELTNDQVTVMTHAIAVINLAATVCLVAGWYWIRAGDVAKHRLAMLAAFTLILVFLVVYLVRVGGGGEKLFDGPDVVRAIYLAMLFVHILLSIVAMPVVVYALLLGLTHSVAELRQTRHAAVGRIAAGAWILSLVLGVVTYLMLNHVYDYEFASVIVPLV